MEGSRVHYRVFQYQVRQDLIHISDKINFVIKLYKQLPSDLERIQTKVKHWSTLLSTQRNTVKWSVLSILSGVSAVAMHPSFNFAPWVRVQAFLNFFFWLVWNPHSANNPIKTCNFTEHSFCVANIITAFANIDCDCPMECEAGIWIFLFLLHNLRAICLNFSSLSLWNLQANIDPCWKAESYTHSNMQYAELEVTK